MGIRIAINGFGRIGRCIARAHNALSTQEKKKMPIVAINTTCCDVNGLAHLFEYDSNHGCFKEEIKVDGNTLDYGDGIIKVLNYDKPADIPWSNMEVDLVLECSGIFNTFDKASQHLDAGAKFVLISAPCQGCNNTMICSINDFILQDMLLKPKSDKQNRVLSAGSCTTNAFMPILYPLHHEIGIEMGFVNTIHAYTNDQNLLDNTHKDLRRARSAACSMIPTSTGVSNLIPKLIPDLEGKIGASAIRVPIPNVSLIDFTFVTKQPIKEDKISEIMINFSQKVPDIVAINKKKLVSIDFNHTTHSTIFDITQTTVSNAKFCRVASWYDNEWAFAHRMLDITKKIQALGLR